MVDQLSRAAWSASETGPACVPGICMKRTAAFLHACACALFLGSARASAKPRFSSGQSLPGGGPDVACWHMRPPAGSWLERPVEGGQCLDESLGIALGIVPMVDPEMGVLAGDLKVKLSVIGDIYGAGEEAP